MARGELVSFQLTLPGDGGVVRVPQYARGPKGERPMFLSTTRLETAADHLDHPEKPVSDPRKIPIEQHSKILEGNALHRTAQLTQMWQSARPRDTHGYKPEYYRRLARVVELAPTAKSGEVRTAATILADPRMAMPRLNSERFQKEERAVYRLIAAAVCSDMKTKPPFTKTMALPEIAAMAQLSQELPFPNPAAVGAAWDKSGSDQNLLRLTDRLFDYHRSQPIRPADYYSPKPNFTCYASELRVTAWLGAANAIWSGRMDEVTRGKSTESPHTHVRVVDYKSGRLSFPPAESYSRAAVRASMMMTARLAAALPDRISPTGTAVKVMANPGTINPDVEVEINYVGLGGDRPNEIKFGEYWGHDWSSPGKAREETGRFFDLLAVIRANPELEPFLR